MERRYARVKLTENNHVNYYGDLQVRTIYKNFFIPHGCWRYERDGVALLEENCFIRRGLNPCQMIEGYIETITVKY